MRLVRYYIDNKELLDTTYLGIVESGTKKKLSIDVKNTYPYPAALTDPYVLDANLKILEYPSVLKAFESGKIVIEFSPPENREEPLEKGFGFKVVYG